MSEPGREATHSWSDANGLYWRCTGCGAVTSHRDDAPPCTGRETTLEEAAEVERRDPPNEDEQMGAS